MRRGPPTPCSLAMNTAQSVSQQSSKKASIISLANFAAGLAVYLPIKALQYKGDTVLIFCHIWRFGYVDITQAHLSYAIIPLYFAALCVIYKCWLSQFLFQVGIRALFLGITMAGGFLVAESHSICSIFGWYMCFMAFFHFSEFFVSSITNPSELTVDLYMINHSLEYNVAAVLSWVEFFTEAYLYPEMKSLKSVSLLGCLVCILGDALRKTAIITAAHNFTHKIQHIKKEDHELVTHGVFSLLRHPSYVGWFYWSIGTQIVLLNPMCIVGYTVASWSFFYDRIFFEEIYLIKFFGEDYLNYQKKVSTGLPLIKGFELNKYQTNGSEQK